jgi:hypothetical protein
MALHSLIEETAFWGGCTRFRRPVRQIGGKTRRPLIHPKKDRRPGQSQNGMIRRNPGQVVPGYKGLAAPDGQDCTARQSIAQTLGIPPEDGMPVQPRPAKGYSFGDAHDDLTFPRSLDNGLPSRSIALAKIECNPQTHNLRANNDNSPQH